MVAYGLLYISVGPVGVVAGYKGGAAEQCQLLKRVYDLT